MQPFELYCGDILKTSLRIPDECADMVFADPPFNVGKDYGEGVEDNVPRSEYLKWCHNWLREAYRVLRPGGSIYVMNLSENAAHHIVDLESMGGEFQNLIAWRETSWHTPKNKYCKSHQDIVFMTKPGRAHTFNCFADYGAHDRHWGGKEHLKQSEGARLTDIWQDISRIKGNWKEAIAANGRKVHPCQMPLKLARRVVLVSTNPGDMVIEFFSGSGTLGTVCVQNGRRFIGIERSSNYVLMAAQRIEAATQQPLLMAV